MGLFTRFKNLRSSNGRTEEKSDSKVSVFDDSKSVNSLEVNVNGAVSVTENRIYVINPSEEGAFATLWIPSDNRLELLVNNRPMTGHVIIREEDNIRIEFHHVSARIESQVIVDEARLTVAVRIVTAQGKRYSLKDVPSTRNAILDILEESIPPDPLGTNHIKELLQEFTGTIDDQAMKILGEAITDSELIVLRGKPPLKGREAKFSKIVHPQMNGPRGRVTSVVMGQTVAFLEPALPCRAGTNVFGEVIPCRSSDRQPLTGSGVTAVQNRIVSLKSGRLVFSHAFIDVVPELVIDGDLRPEHGAITFDGDVFVRGSITDGCSVSASGLVTVYEAVLGCHVVAEGGLRVAGSIVHSSVSIGQKRLFYQYMEPLLSRVVMDLQKFELEYVELERQANVRQGMKNMSSMLGGILLERRHPTLESLFVDFVHRHETDEVQALHDDTYTDIVREIRTRWQGVHRASICAADALRLRSMIQRYVDNLQRALTLQPARLRVDSIMSSSIHVAGDLVVTGVGVYNSTLVVHRTILVRGFIRGGHSSAEKAVYVYETGTPLGAEVIIRVMSREGRIHIDVRHPNTLLEVAGKRSRNATIEYDVRYRLYE